MKILNLHPWKVSPEEAIRIQKELVKRLKIEKIKKIETVAGCDAWSKEGRIYGAVCIFSYPQLNLLEIVKKNIKESFPYIPGLLSFREGPVFISCFKSLKINPDLIIFDGQGIAHPRYMGLATHLGIILDKPTIGCAKKPLVGNYDLNNLGKEKGSYLLWKDKNKKIVGAVLRSREGVKPIFISCGYKIDLSTALKIIISLCKNYRIPEPLRIAHIEAKRFN